MGFVKVFLEKAEWVRVSVRGGVCTESGLASNFQLCFVSASCSFADKTCYPSFLTLKVAMTLLNLSHEDLNRRLKLTESVERLLHGIHLCVFIEKMYGFFRDIFPKNFCLKWEISKMRKRGTGKSTKSNAQIYRLAKREQQMEAFVYS